MQRKERAWRAAVQRTPAATWSAPTDCRRMPRDPTTLLIRQHSKTTFAPVATSSALLCSARSMRDFSWKTDTCAVKYKKHVSEGSDSFFLEKRFYLHELVKSLQFSRCHILVVWNNLLVGDILKKRSKIVILKIDFVFIISSWRIDSLTWQNQIWHFLFFIRKNRIDQPC